MNKPFTTQEYQTIPSIYIGVHSLTLSFSTPTSSTHCGQLKYGSTVHPRISEELTDDDTG